MLVIVSDLHLADGTTGKTVHQGTLRMFRERLRALAYAASWRTDGRYQPIEAFDVLLAGDILDVLRSTLWLEKDDRSQAVRPWDDRDSPQFIAKVKNVTDAILAHNTTFFTMLREVSRAGIITLPPADSRGQPAKIRGTERNVERVPVKARFHFMVGNHDWFYHVPSAAYHGVRRSVVEAMGLENHPQHPFPHDPSEPSAAAVLEAFRQHRVFARHGDIFDPVNFEGNRDGSSLGDSIVIDLVTKFAFEVHRSLGNSLPRECLSGLSEIDNVRPFSMVPAWVGGLLERTCRSSRDRRRIQEAWKETVDQWLRIPFVKERLSTWKFSCRAQSLSWTLTLSKTLMSPSASRCTRWLSEKVGSHRQSYLRHALHEPWFRNRAARFIVYGHTHHHEVVPMDVTRAPEGLLNQIYVNSGTWRPVYELARFRPGRQAFMGYHAVTYSVFFKDDERNGRLFECWSGKLSESARRCERPADRDEALPEAAPSPPCFLNKKGEGRQ